MKTGEKIRYLRIKNNLTSKELSKALNVSEAAISLYENNKRNPSVEQIIKIADYFKVSTDFLLGVSDKLQTNNHYESITDFSTVIENIITLLNKQNYIIFDGKDVDDKATSAFKTNLNCLLENMRMITDR